MELGERLYRLRKERNLSQGEVADALGVSRQSVSKWENSTSVPELDKLVKLGALFGLTLDELVTGEAPAAPAAQLSPAAGAADGQRIAAIVLLACGGVLSLLFLATTLFYFAVWLVVAGLLCWHVREHLGIALGLTFWLFGVLFFRACTSLSPWSIFYPAAYRSFPPATLLLDWTVFAALLLLLGLALRAVWARFGRPALLRLGLAAALFLGIRVLTCVLVLSALSPTSVVFTYWPVQLFWFAVVLALFPLSWGGYRRRPFVVAAVYLLSFGLNSLVTGAATDDLFLSYYWPLLLLLLYLAAAWTGAAWERRLQTRESACGSWNRTGKSGQ